MFMNSNLFEPGKSKAEKTFIQQAVKQNNRFDGRRSTECRDVELTFGSDWGTVAVSLGETKVLAQVSCDIGVPTIARPNEGKLILNVNINGVAFLDEVQSTYDQRFLTLNSLLERTFRTSRCLDMESMCIASELHVWCVRVDINVLNHDGNLYDASTIATLAALMHYRRPDVKFADDELHIYTEKEREYQPLLFLHYPVSVTYCIYKTSSQPIVDPTLLEENAADSVIVLSFNSYQELCTLNAGGSAPTNVRTIMQCARSAAKRSKALVDFIRKALGLHEAQRSRGSQYVPGLLSLVSETAQKVSFHKLMKDELGQERYTMEASQMEVDEQPPKEVELVAEDVDKVELPKQEKETPMDDSTWLPEESTEATVPTPKPGKNKRNRNKANKKQQNQPTKKPQNDSDSEEETKPVL